MSTLRGVIAAGLALILVASLAVDEPRVLWLRYLGAVVILIAAAGAVAGDAIPARPSGLVASVGAAAGAVLVAARVPGVVPVAAAALALQAMPRALLAARRRCHH